MNEHFSISFETNITLIIKPDKKTFKENRRTISLINTNAKFLKNYRKFNPAIYKIYIKIMDHD